MRDWFLLMSTLLPVVNKSKKEPTTMTSPLPQTPSPTTALVGRARVWSTLDSPTHPAIFTPFSFVHMVSGAALFLTLQGAFPLLHHNVWWHVLSANGVHMLYEMKDIGNSYFQWNMYVGGTEPSRCSALNSIGDQIAASVGACIVAAVFHMLHWRKKTAVVSRKATLIAAVAAWAVVIAMASCITKSGWEGK